ncbi:MAG TPA: NAD-dependent epimerase/dehydratase family protein [Candidatus Omnitrophota bacterium]|nr:NAD-dependent epimerase/dehydratase family protein [Candidatus Omnitrophota bacterium]HPS20099.1 NAD-dependent epimerase/dehydratase family protein [Candidatus Omnitrophota bacterium]
MRKYFIVGGAGFIGSQVAESISKEEADSLITIYDNFSSGKKWHLDNVKDKERLRIIKGDVKNKNRLIRAMKGSDIVYHFAANPDIAKAVTYPEVDFWEGTYLVNNMIEAMRVNGIKKLIYASGSGIYGDAGEVELDEEYPVKAPISTYGASKLGCEALISAYCHMFGMTGICFRFANVVGPRQTHGVGYDFVRKLLKDPRELGILGDGNQSKSYIYVTDIINAMRLLEKSGKEGYQYYNVATQDYITVKEIADIVLNVMGITGTKYNFTGEDRGWKGDVPVVRFNTDKIRALGWTNKCTSKEAITRSIESIYNDVKLKRIRY